MIENWMPLGFRNMFDRRPDTEPAKAEAHVPEIKEGEQPAHEEEPKQE